MINERIIQVLPSKAAAKRESASGTLDKMVMKRRDARNRPVRTPKLSPRSLQRQDEHSQQQASCRAVGGKEATEYRSMSPLTGPTNIFDSAEKPSQQTQHKLRLEALS